MPEIIVAKNAGFCFGVKRAVDAVQEIIGKHKHIYTYGELIHNSDVVASLARGGVQVIEDIAQIPQEEDTVVVIRSHGVPKAVYEQIERRGFEILDLTCPFVKRIHDKVKTAQVPVIIIGAQNHPEVVGIRGWVSGESHVVGSVEEARELPHFDAALVVAQTTITTQLWDDVTKILQNGDYELFHSICDTTQKRQTEAQELASKSDIVLVVGGKHSSNTQKLFQICKKNCKKSYYVDNIRELPLEMISNHGIISIVAGASTPDWLIMEVETQMSEVEKVLEPTMEEEVSQEQSQANEDFMQQIEDSFVYIKRGQIVTGTVVQVSDSEICVNIGYKSDGIIKKENLSTNGDVSPAEMCKVGDEIEAEVVSLNDGEGNVVLSRRSIESKLKWKELVETLDNEKVYTVKVDRVVKGGVLAKLEGYDAFIPASQLSLKYVEDLSEFVGQDLAVNIVDVDKRQRRFVLSHKNILQAEADEKEKELYATFKKGDIIKGKIRRLTDFGAFIDIGGVDGLLHVTDIAWVKVKHPSDMLKVGDEIEVQILNVDTEKKRISLGLKQLSPKPWDLAPEKYLVGDTVEGTVVRIMPFGAFVSLEPTIDGLVHISQVTNRRLEKVEEELRIGDKVTAKVMEVNPSKKRISLSIRALLPEEVRPSKKEEHSGEERFSYEIPTVENVTTSLADLFNLNSEEKED